MAGPPTQASLDPSTGLPKAASPSPPSPPPAYFPPARHLRQQAAAQRVAENPNRPVSAAQFLHLRSMDNADYNNSGEYSNLDDPHDDDDDRSPIELRITTTVQVEGNNNAILLTASPAAHAEVIAEAITAMVRQAGGMNGGIPMIDEEGRPRPFRISISAGINIEGSGNVLGNADHIMRVLRGKRRRDDGGDTQDADEAVGDSEGEGAVGPRLRRPRRSSL